MYIMMDDNHSLARCGHFLKQLKMAVSVDISTLQMAHPSNTNLLPGPKPWQ